MKQYSFIDSEYLEEGRIKNAIIGGLSLLAAAGASTAKLPQSYIKNHPRQYRFYDVLADAALRGPKHPVNASQNIKKGFGIGMDVVKQANPAMVQAEKLGNAITNSYKGRSSFATNASDVVNGNITLK